MKEKITEMDSRYDDLESMSVQDLLQGINQEDQTVAIAVKKVIPELTRFIEKISKKMKAGGRLFYLGAGTSGRLGILDASECPPTFGVDHGMVIGLIAGGDGAIRRAVEFAEDDAKQGWNDLRYHKISTKDVVIGIAASGTTPYVLGAIQECNKRKILTGGITCNPKSPLAIKAKHPIVAIVGPEFVTGSTRMKSGTAQKLILNMITTTVMIQLGRVKGNKMVDMKMSNIKLVERGTKMLMESLHIKYEKAGKLLAKHGSVRKAMTAGKKDA